VPRLDTQQVSKLLREYAQRSALRGGNPYRAKAYSRAADSLAALALPLDILIAGGRLTEIPGVGDAIADIITKLHRDGTHPSLEKLRKEIPAGGRRRSTAITARGDVEMGIFTKDIRSAGPWSAGHLLRGAADHQIAAQDD